MRMYQHTYAPKTDLRWVLLGVRRHPCPMTCPCAAVFPHEHCTQILKSPHTWPSYLAFVFILRMAVRRCFV